MNPLQTSEKPDEKAATPSSPPPTLWLVLAVMAVSLWCALAGGPPL